MIFKAIKVEDELPEYPQIVTVLLDGRLQMMAQIRPSGTGPVWWSLGGPNAYMIEEKKKCVTHWLKEIPTKFSPPDNSDICWYIGSEIFTRKEVADMLHTQRAMIGNDLKTYAGESLTPNILDVLKNPRVPDF